MNISFFLVGTCVSNYTASHRGRQILRHDLDINNMHLNIFYFKLGSSKSCPCNGPWRPIGLSDVEAPTFSRQSAHRWQWICQPYAPAALYTPRKIPGTHFCWRLSRPQGHNSAGRLRSTEKSNDIIGNRTRDLPACSIVPQPTTLPCAPWFSWHPFCRIKCRIRCVISLLFHSSFVKVKVKMSLYLIN
jgi:hypothetical protein